LQDLEVKWQSTPGRSHPAGTEDVVNTTEKLRNLEERFTRNFSRSAQAQFQNANRQSPLSVRKKTLDAVGRITARAREPDDLAGAL
jgi:hypothetical protein